jgi:hypothetical protein
MRTSTEYALNAQITALPARIASAFSAPNPSSTKTANASKNARPASSKNKAIAKNARMTATSARTKIPALSAQARSFFSTETARINAQMVSTLTPTKVNVRSVSPLDVLTAKQELPSACSARKTLPFLKESAFKTAPQDGKRQIALPVLSACLIAWTATTVMRMTCAIVAKQDSIFLLIRRHVRKTAAQDKERA